MWVTSSFDADGEVVLLFAVKVVIHGLDHRGRELLAAKAETAAEYLDIGHAFFKQRGHHVGVQRLALGAPASLVRSSTAIFLQVFGMALKSLSAQKGRYMRTLIRAKFFALLEFR